ncbi:MAG: cytochrome b/b6 domain-containing protein [Burkholderiaceae bacterium]|nr:cytochrome b/b6 domain-containing protein [Burkholderiaceae bacterium]
MTDRRVRVWDLPTRFFHWALLVCIIGSLVSVKLGGDAIAWHFRFGFAILTLISFRVIWGFIGSRYARFASFPPNPVSALKYLGGRAESTPGHNPLGAFSVYALLAALAFQAGTGLFANDSIMWDGPLKSLVSSDTSDLITTLHRRNRFVVIGLIALHLGAIAYYARIKKEALVAPMVGGDREYPAGTPLPEAADDSTGLRLRALIVLVACAVAVGYTVTQVR